MRKLHYKNLKATFNLSEEKSEAEKGIIEAYVSIFDNVDLGGDKIIKGAFAESLGKKFPVGVWMHNWDEPIAKTLVAREDEKGLYIKAQLIEGVQRADEAYLLLKQGVIDEFSIGYRVLDHEWEENGTRVLKKLKLYEWSPVLAGMNPDTELLNVKSADARKLNFVKIDAEKGEVKLYYCGGKKCDIIKMSKRYIKCLATREEKREKVEPKAEGEKILRVRTLVKEIDKASEKVLRIIKS